MRRFANSFSLYLTFLFILLILILSVKADQSESLEESLKDISTQGQSLEGQVESLTTTLSSYGDLYLVVKEQVEKLRQHVQQIPLHAREALNNIEDLSYVRYKKVLLQSANSRASSSLTRIKILLLRSGEDYSGVKKNLEEISQQLEALDLLIEKLPIPHPHTALLTTTLSLSSFPSPSILTAFGQNDFRLLSQEEVLTQEAAQTLGSLMVVLIDDSEVNGDGNGDLGEIFAEPFCSGIQVSPRHFLTAAHCTNYPHIIFNKKRIAHRDHLNSVEIETGPSDTPSGPQRPYALRLVFTGDEIPESEEVVHSQKPIDVPLFKNDQLDFAIYELTGRMDGPYVDLFHLLDFSSEENYHEKNYDLVAYGFPHGLPLTESSFCTGTLVDDGSVQNPVLSLKHDCDTMTGSSGGALFQKGKKGQLWPMAMQISGPFLNQGRHFREHGKFEEPGSQVRNRAISLRSIVQNLPADIQEKIKEAMQAKP